MRGRRVAASPTIRSSARSIAVSSAMLLVPTPRYSPCSLRLLPSMATMPIPIGPGLPEHAPSVHSCTAPAPSTTTAAFFFAAAAGGADEDEEADADAIDLSL